MPRALKASPHCSSPRVRVQGECARGVCAAVHGLTTAADEAFAERRGGVPWDASLLAIPAASPSVRELAATFFGTYTPQALAVLDDDGEALARREFTAILQGCQRAYGPDAELTAAELSLADQAAEAFLNSTKVTAPGPCTSVPVHSHQRKQRARRCGVPAQEQ